MTLFPGYREFYQRALLPMGRKDKALFHELNESSSTHWLIALQGFPRDSYSDYFHWHVLIFPAKKDSSFCYDKPFYKSETFSSIHRAFESSKAFADLAVADNLTSCQREERIS